MNTIHLHPEDNIVIAKEDIPAAALLHGQVPAKEAIARMHKAAIKPLEPGAAIIKYGQVIGMASRPIAAGEHVHVHNCEIGDFRRDYDFCGNARPTDVVAAADRARFMGYRRANGDVGTRNYVAILTTVNCSATVARSVAEAFKAPGMLDTFGNVDGIVPLVHTSGCGMSPGGKGYQLLRRTLSGYARHANFGGVVIIGLGCETMQIADLMEEYGLREADNVRTFNIQEVDGTRNAIDTGVGIVREMLPAVNNNRREEVDASHLKLAVQCGGSDAFSGITANPALGVAADLVVRNGGTVIYSETPEIYGAEHLLTRRAASPAVAEKLLEHVHWWENYTRLNGVELNNNPSPGNKAGGLTTILEKSLGAQAKGGTTNLNAVYDYAERVTQSGLVFMDSPGFDPVSVTGQVASGANLVCFTTGRGSAFGQKPVPSIKLSSNTPLYERMSGDIDINCGAVLDGELTLEQCGGRIFQAVLAVASGERTKSEQLGYGDNEFAPWQMGAVI